MKFPFSSGQWRAIALALIAVTAAMCHNPFKSTDSTSGLTVPEIVHVGDTTGPKIHARNSVRNWINWNVLFTPAARAGFRTQYMTVLRSNIIAYIHANARFFRNNIPVEATSKNYVIKQNTCSCDTLLYNVSVDLYTSPVIDTTGEIVTPTPKPKPPVVTGGLVEQMSNNGDLSQGNPALQATKFPRLSDVKVMQGVSVSADTSQILGIIDTGIDSSLFTPAILGLSKGGWLMFNSLPGADALNVSDNDGFSHGSVVLTQALRQYMARYPRVMVIKAFDNKGSGSIFSASCGIKYAIDHHATIINASWGYYGDPDSTLQHYVALTTTTKPYPIIFVAAAGNDSTGADSASRLCEPVVRRDNELKDGHRFYPACFKPIMANMLTVTGLTKSVNGKFFPCYYQNYSKQFVSVGIHDSVQCCSYTVPFINGAVTGTSFCAPVLSGKIGDYMTRRPAGVGLPTVTGFLSLIGGQVSSLDSFTISGSYLPSRQRN